MRLENLRPKQINLELNEKIYIFRPMTLEDQIWITTEYGADLTTVFGESVDFKAISRIAYRLLTDKSAYKPIQEVDYDEDGNAAKQTIGGVRLFEREFVGINDLMKLVEVVVQAFGVDAKDAATEPQGKKQSRSKK